MFVRSQPVTAGGAPEGMELHPNEACGKACPAGAIKKPCGNQCQFDFGCTPRAASGVNPIFVGAFLGSASEKKELLSYAAEAQKGLKELAYTKPG
jgi:hypothetical protein